MNALQHSSASAGVGVSAAIVLSWLVEILTSVKTPPDVLAAEGVLLTWAAGYFFHRGELK